MISAGLFLLVVILLAARALAPQTELSGPMPVGVDVSHHQGVIDWDTLAGDEVRFAYIKATEGGDWVDTRFAENWRAAKRTSIARGAYHFFTLCTPAEVQAANFIATVGALDRDLPPALDIEHMGPCSEGPTMERPAEEARVFLDRLEAHYGVRPIIYTTRQFHDAHLREMTGERFWVRSILREPTWRTEEWTLWQYHNRGRREGVVGPVDLNRLNGDMATLQAMLVSGG
jgi:lysozyme